MRSVSSWIRDQKTLVGELNSMSDNKRQQHSNLLKGAGLLAGTGAILLATEQQADAGPIEDVTATVNSLGGLAAAALAVALVPFGIVYAVRIVKRVMNA